MSKRKKRSNKAANVIWTTVLLAAVCLFVFSLYQLAMMLIPYYTGGKEYDKVKKLVVTAEHPEEQDGEEQTAGFQVDFTELLKLNADTAAWIRFDEPSVISYPVVQGVDNQEYLYRSFTTEDTNKLGTIFIDVRNQKNFTDRNTFIYGHNLKVGGEMFSQLNEYADEAFCKEHPYFYIYTPDGKMRTYRVFSAGVVNEAADNYEITYDTDEEYLQYLELCRSSSNYTVDAELNEQSQIVSLSTCTNVRDEERFLVQGVLEETTDAQQEK